MDNAQKAIMIGVGLFITIIIIAAVMTITGIGQNLLNQGQTQLSDLSEQLQREIYDGFDNKELSGSEVLTAIKKYYTNSKVSFIVYNNASTTSSDSPLRGGAKYITLNNRPDANSDEVTLNGTSEKLDDFDTSKKKTVLSNFSNTSKTSDYISPARTYKSLIVKQNDAVVGICFIKK